MTIYTGPTIGHVFKRACSSFHKKHSKASHAFVQLFKACQFHAIQSKRRCTSSSACQATIMQSCKPKQQQEQQMHASKCSSTTAQPKSSSANATGAPKHKHKSSNKSTSSAKSNSSAKPKYNSQGLSKEGSNNTIHQIAPNQSQHGHQSAPNLAQHLTKITNQSITKSINQ